MQVKEITVKRHVDLEGGQSLDISITGAMDGIENIETAQRVLYKILNSGVVKTVKDEIMDNFARKPRLQVH